MTDPDDITGAVEGPHLPAHVYVHVPFCRIKCSYCDFYSVDDISHDTIGAVIKGIQGQLGRWQTVGLPGVIETIYVGGGTPTLIVGGLLEIIDAARELAPLRKGAEITIEANPDSVTPDFIEVLAAAGVTRVSVGVQSFNPTELALLGRIHTVDEAVLACSAVTASGLDLSVDLMCGIPGQTMASWTGSVDRAIRTGAGHVSVYPLTLEPGTPLGVAVDADLVPEPDPDLAADMMLVAEEMLTAAGLPRYEVANYARPGQESRHNLAYWTGRSYLGIGPAAHGMLDAETARTVGMLPPDAPADIERVRYENPATLDAFLFMREQAIEFMTADEVAREDVMLGLRLTRGVATAQIEAAGLIPVLQDLEREGLVERFAEQGRERYRTTRRGWLLGNEVFGRVWGRG